MVTGRNVTKVVACTSLKRRKSMVSYHHVECARKSVSINGESYAFQMEIARTIQILKCILLLRVLAIGRALCSRRKAVCIIIPCLKFLFIAAAFFTERKEQQSNYQTDAVVLDEIDLEENESDPAFSDHEDLYFYGNDTTPAASRQTAQPTSTGTQRLVPSTTQNRGNCCNYYPYEHAFLKKRYITFMLSYV